MLQAYQETGQATTPSSSCLPSSTELTPSHVTLRRDLKAQQRNWVSTCGLWTTSWIRCRWLPTPTSPYRAGNVDFYILYTNDIASNPQIMDILVAAKIPVLSIATAAVASNGTTAPLIFTKEDNYNLAFESASYLGKHAKEQLGWKEERTGLHQHGLPGSRWCFP
jgi:hypothetical protein